MASQPECADIVLAHSLRHGGHNILQILTPWEISIGIRPARFIQGSNMLASVHQVSAPLYQYVFEFLATVHLRAAHGSEIPFVFSNATSNPNARPGADKVENAMSDAWIAFAHHSNPNHAGRPNWPVYDLESRAVMVFDVNSRVENDLRKAERLAHERVRMR